MVLSPARETGVGTAKEKSLFNFFRVSPSYLLLGSARRRGNENEASGASVQTEVKASPGKEERRPRLGPAPAGAGRARDRDVPCRVFRPEAPAAGVGVLSAAALSFSASVFRQQSQTPPVSYTCLLFFTR